MKRNILLSICIPTYNRKDFLIKTLTKISRLKEAEEIEIVIGDDGSTDNTHKSVSRFVKSHPSLNIVFKRFETRMYFDKMILEIVKIARGKYCWLISDDDLPFSHSVKKIKEIVIRNPKTSFIHMNYERYDNLLKKVTAKRMVGSMTKDLSFKNSDDFFFMPITKSYFKYLGTNTITMSTDVFDRKKWIESTKSLTRFVGHNFIHCFAICTLIKKYPNIYYIGRPSVRYLSNNHRVWPNDIWKDYNNVFLKYLRSIGYSPKLLNNMSLIQRQYEQREGLMKNKYLKFVYKLLRPAYIRFQHLYSKINEK